MSVAVRAEGKGAEGPERVFEALAGIASRTLSSRAQSPLRVCLESCRPTRLGALADLARAHDRAVSLRIGGACDTTILVSQFLAFAMLALRFGGRGPAAAEPAPERRYTAIEEEALVRTALELNGALAAASAGRLAGEPSAAGLLDAAALRGRAEERVLLASFTVEGLPGEARFWIALAQDAAQGGESHEDEAVGALAAPRGNAAARDAAGDAAEDPPEVLGLRPGVRMILDLTGPRGASLRVDGKLVARGRARFADTRVVLDVEDGGDDGDPPL